MGWFDDSQQQNQDVYNGNPDPNTGSYTHEAIAGAAGFEAAKAWENKQRADGQPVDHAFAKEAIAGLAGAEVDKLAETKGLDYIDREKAKRDAATAGGQVYDSQFGDQSNYDPNSAPQPNW